MTELAGALRAAADFLDEYDKYPHGVPVFNDDRTAAGEACVRLCNGNPDKARTLWKRVTDKLEYMPYAAAVALVIASETDNLVPDIPEPDLDGPR